MSGPALTRCTACHHRFRPEPNERPLDGGGVHVFLVCPNCAAEYPSADVSAEGVRLRAQLEAMRRQGRTGTAKFQKMLQRFKGEVTRRTGARA